MNSKLSLAIVFPCALAACLTPEEVTQDDPPPVVTALCTEATEVPCRDDSLVDLSMNAEDVAPGLIDNEALADGFHTSIDATAGGAFNGQDGYVYGKFTNAGLVKVEITDDASFESMDWDVSFRRFVIRLNSGTGGPSCVTAARTAVDTDFATSEFDTSLLEFNAEQYMSEGTCDLIPDGSGLQSAGVVLQGFWRYPGCVQMTGNVYLVSLADGRLVKLLVTHFYHDAAQQECQETDTTDSDGSGNIQLDWAFLD